MSSKQYEHSGFLHPWILLNLVITLTWLCPQSLTLPLELFLPEESEHGCLVSGGVAWDYGVIYKIYKMPLVLSFSKSMCSDIYFSLFKHNIMFFFSKLLTWTRLLLFCHLYAAAWEAQSQCRKCFLQHIYIQMKKCLTFPQLSAWLASFESLLKSHFSVAFSSQQIENYILHS